MMPDFRFLFQLSCPWYNASFPVTNVTFHHSFHLVGVFITLLTNGNTQSPYLHSNTLISRRKLHTKSQKLAYTETFYASQGPAFLLTPSMSWRSRRHHSSSSRHRRNVAWRMLMRVSRWCCRRSLRCTHRHHAVVHRRHPLIILYGRGSRWVVKRSF